MAPPAAFSQPQPQMFASMFSLCLFLMFGYLFVGMVYFGTDRDVKFFVGRFSLLTLLWIPIFGLAHWYHIRAKKPRRQLMMACVFPAAVTFFLVSWLVMHKADRITHLLRSSECTRAPEVKELHIAAMAARKFHDKCLAQAKGEYRLIQFCEGYEAAASETQNQEAWNYLRILEHSYACAGFCNPQMEPSMWTYQGYEDTCAVAIANVMKSKVSATAFRMMMYSVLVVFCFLCWIELMMPTLKAVERGEPLPGATASFMEKPLGPPVFAPGPYGAAPNPYGSAAPGPYGAPGPVQYGAAPVQAGLGGAAAAVMAANAMARASRPGPPPPAPAGPPPAFAGP